MATYRLKRKTKNFGLMDNVGGAVKRTAGGVMEGVGKAADTSLGGLAGGIGGATLLGSTIGSAFAPGLGTTIGGALGALGGYVVGGKAVRSAGRALKETGQEWQS